MSKTHKQIMRADAEFFHAPKSVQEVIPIRKVFDDGIFLVGKNKYSRTIRFTDINYAVADDEDKLDVLQEYADFLSTLDAGMTTKITVNNRRLNRTDFEKTILIPDMSDGCDNYRHEYNRNILDKASGAHSMIQDKYLTLSVYKKNIEEARSYFGRVTSEIGLRMKKLGCDNSVCTLEERLRMFHDFFRPDEVGYFRFNVKEKRRRGHGFKDSICPDSFDFEGDYFMMGNRYGRVLFLKEFGSYIKDTLVADLTAMKRNMIMSTDIIPVPIDEAMREAENRLLGVETEIANFQRRQNANNNFSATIPYDLEQQRQEMKDFLDDLTTKDRRMTYAVVTIVLTADNLKQLDEDTKAIMNTAAGDHCQLGILRYQQMDGLVTAMPFGVLKIKNFRTMTTESLTAIHPFRVQDAYHPHGIYLGQNVISGNMIAVDVGELMNGNSVVLGVPGGGKSMVSKYTLFARFLSDPNCEIMIIDPEREYGPLVRALGGENIYISSTSFSHINPMDLNSEYGDGANPVILKSEFIMSLIEQVVGVGALGPKEKSIIDRCTASVYRAYQQRDYKGTPPTLQDFRIELLAQPEPEAKELALSIELFTSGSLNTFAQLTNVDTQNRLICYDILDLGKQLTPMGMLVVLDSILNRITRNRARGKRTYIYIDEIYLLFQNEYSANFLFTLWKRVRKYGAFATGITQNVEDMLQSHTARTMLSNSEFLIMLNQAATDREELAKLLNISANQMSYITNAESGHGLMKIGSSLVPFANIIPSDTQMYKLMSTKPGESA